VAGPPSNYEDEILRAIEEMHNQDALVGAKHGDLANKTDGTRDYYNLQAARAGDTEGLQGFQSGNPDVDLLARLAAKQAALTGARDNELQLQGQPREDVLADQLARAAYRGF
jgi:hypothetical protein